MTQTDTPVIPTPAPAQRKWPLAGVVWIDLVLVAVLVLVITTVIQLVFLWASAYSSGLSLQDLPKDQNALIRLIGIRGIFVSTLVQNLIFVGIPLLRVLVVRRESRAVLGYTLDRPLFQIGAGFGFGIAAIVINVGLSALFSQVFKIEQNQSDQFTAFLSQNDYIGMLLFFVLATILAPIGEETLFRGYLFNALRSPGGRFWLILAYIVSAGVFSLIHLPGVTQGAIALLIPIFLVGLLFAAAVHTTGSIIPAMIAHAMNNSIATFGLIVCVQIGLEQCRP